jgi:hypothetical protein
MARKISGKGGAGMIGGVRSPMATSGHGIVAKPKLNPSVAANTTRPGIAKSSAPIRSPFNAGAIVKY